jgi:hypothetical protein
MGAVIRAYRHHCNHGPHGLAQDVVAGWAGITQGRLSRIETGPPIQQLDRLIAWARLLGIPQDLLWFDLPEDEAGGPPAHPWTETGHVAGGSPDGEEDELSLAAERAAALGTDLWELHDVLDARSVSPTSLALAETGAAWLDARYGETAPQVLLPELRRQLNHVAAWLREPQHVVLRRRSCSVAARLAGLRAWVYFDMAEHTAADAWYGVAMSAAREAEDDDLSGYLLGARSLIRTDRQDHRAAVELLAGAQNVVGRAGSPTTRAWLDILEARALAGTGDRRGFAAAFQRASKKRSRTSRDHGRHGMDFVGDHLDVGYYAGLSYLLVDEPAAAAAAFQEALAGLPPERLKARAMLMLSVAMAAALDRRPDLAAVTASEAMTVADGQPIGRVWARVNDVRRVVAASPSSARELDEHMVHYAAALERATSGAVP